MKVMIVIQITDKVLKDALLTFLDNKLPVILWL